LPHLKILIYIILPPGDTKKTGGDEMELTMNIRWGIIKLHEPSRRKEIN